MLPHKYVWADGQLMIAPGWRKDIHHLHLMQDLMQQLGINSMPQDWTGGTYNEDTFTGQPSIYHDWESVGNVPSDNELIEMIQQHLNQQQQHIGRVSRRPW